MGTRTEPQTSTSIAYIVFSDDPRFLVNLLLKYGGETAALQRSGFSGGNVTWFSGFGDGFHRLRVGHVWRASGVESVSDGSVTQLRIRLPVLESDSQVSRVSVALVRVEDETELAASATDWETGPGVRAQGSPEFYWSAERVTSQTGDVWRVREVAGDVYAFVGTSEKENQSHLLDLVLDNKLTGEALIQGTGYNSAGF